MISLLLLAVLGADGGTDAGRLDGGRPDAGPPVPTWLLSSKMTADAGIRAELIADLTKGNKSDGGSVGESPLTIAEANALLDDPRAQLIYGEKTVSIVAPSMVMKQRQDHIDLMKLFLAPERVKAGAEFVKKNEVLFDRVEKKTGVAREVITGILMWESKLGTITGDFRAFNVFTSQAFFIDEANEIALARLTEKKLLDEDTQKARVEKIRERSRRNLLALARQCKAKGIDTLEVKGSWAGALGFPQFMPASLRWAEDGDGDGKIDLFTMDDSIASIGRYLGEHHFTKDRKKAVWAYNHEAAYVDGVLAFADALKPPVPDAGVKDGPVKDSGR